MITLHDLDTAIAHCQGEAHPNAETCKQLAAFYTIRQAMYGEPMDAVGKSDRLPQASAGYSGDPGPSIQPETYYINYESGSEFSRAINGKSTEPVLDILDELLGVLQATNPRLYNCVLDRLDQI